MSRIVLALTGPTGSGKTTIGEGLAKSLDKCVNIDADHIKHSIPSGFYKDDTNPGGWSYSEWELVGDSIGLLARNFLEKGFDVIVNGYIDEPAWSAIMDHVDLTHRVLLLPDLEEIVKRDAGRSEEIAMGRASVERHHKHFSTDKFFDDFTTINTSDQSVEETASTIRNILEGKNEQ